MKVYSIGYQGKSLDEVCQTLAAARVDALIDVRERAWSQRPEFRKTRLRSALELHQIAYEHRPDAGNPFRPKIGESHSAESCAARYRAHLLRHPQIIADLSERIQNGTVAFFCYEDATSN